MENASKALIIAGAISVGIIVMNSINKPIDQATSSADSQAVEMFNSKFTGYAGTHKAAAAVQSLLTAIASSQTDVHGQTLYSKVKMTAKTPTSKTVNSVAQAQGLVQTGKYYTVTFTYVQSGADAGYINSCTIAEE